MPDSYLILCRMGVLDDIILSNTMWLAQDDIDAPGTLHIMISKGRDLLRIVLTDDDHLLAIHKVSDMHKIYDTREKIAESDDIKQIQTTIKKYLDSDIKNKADILKALEYFPILTKYIQTSNIALAKNLSMENIHSYISTHIKKMDKYIDQYTKLYTQRSNQTILYNNTHTAYKKLKSQYNALTTVYQQSSHTKNIYLEQLNILYRENLRYLTDLNKQEKTTKELIDTLYKHINYIHKDQMFLADFDAISVNKSDKAIHKLMIRKKDIELQYAGGFDKHILTTEARIALQKKELTDIVEMRRMIEDQQQDYINQFVVLYQPAEYIQKDIMSYTNKIEETKIMHKKSQREVNKYSRQIDTFRYTNKILDLMCYEKKYIIRRAATINDNFLAKIHYILTEYSKMSLEHTNILHVSDRCKKYEKLLYQYTHATKNNGTHKISNKLFFQLFFLLEKDFISISQRNPRLYMSHKQKYELVLHIDDLKKHLIHIDQGFIGKDKNSPNHIVAQKPYIDAIDMDTKLIKDIEKDTQIRLQKMVRNQQTASTRTTLLARSINQDQQFILKSGKQIHDMLSSHPQEQSHTQIDKDGMRIMMQKLQDKLQIQAGESKEISDQLYDHILQIHKIVLDDAKNYINKLIESVHNFESKPTSGVPQAFKMTGGDKVFLQRSYMLLHDFIERFDALLILTESIIATPSELQYDGNIKSYKEDIKAMIKYIAPYRTD